MAKSDLWIQRAYRKTLYWTGMYACEPWEKILFFTLFFGFFTTLLVSAFTFIPPDLVACYGFLKSRLEASANAKAEL